jgi:hypothetical protein
MTAKDVFINRHGEMRSGWRALLCVALTAAVASLLQIALNPLRSKIDILGPLLFVTSVLLATFLVTRFVNHKSLTAIGLSFHPATFKEFGLGCLLGVIMISAVFVVEYALGYVQFTWRDFGIWKTAGIFAYSAIFFAVAALGEETLFRGYVFQTLIQGLTFLPAMLIMAFLFAFAHTLNPHAGTFGLINVALAAIWLSVAYMKTRSLWLPFGLHFSWNFMQTSIYSFPTSGIDFVRYQLGETVQSGPEWITGGAFGPEGGAVATLALILCTWYVLKSKRISVPDGIITLDSVEDLLSAQATSGEEAS